MTKSKQSHQQPQESPQPTPCRAVQYEIVPQRGTARIRVRYREGSRTDDCRLCK